MRGKGREEEILWKMKRGLADEKGWVRVALVGDAHPPPLYLKKGDLVVGHFKNSNDLVTS